jgi:hypothetical protein
VDALLHLTIAFLFDSSASLVLFNAAVIALLSD